MTATLTVAAAGRTHIGKVRRRNEDSLYVGDHLAAVADGLGGHVGGDVASAVVIDTIRQADRAVDPESLADVAARAVHAANEAVRRRIADEPGLAGMGSTLVAILWSGSQAAVVNLGDSRVYLHRDGRTVQITEDHTYGNLLAGADRVPTLPERLARYLDGRAVGRSPDITIHDLRPGDRFLLCSDGLSSYVPHDAIHRALAWGTDIENACERLEVLALEAGGPDNVTVALVGVGGDGQ